MGEKMQGEKQVGTRFGLGSKSRVLVWLVAIAAVSAGMVAAFSLPVGGTHKPTIEITYPLDGAVVSGMVVIEGTASDDIQVLGVKVSFDLGATWFDAIDTSGDGSWSTWAYEWDTTKYPNGQQSILAKAWNAHDGHSMADRRVIIHNEGNHPPHVKIIEPKHGSTVSGVVKILLCAWDEDGNDDIEKVYVKIDVGDWHEATFKEINKECSWWVFEWDSTKVDNGWHKICTKATDGKAWGDSCISVFVHNGHPENHPPHIKILKPEAGTTVHGVVQILVCAWDLDGNDDIDQVWVRIDSGEWLKAHKVEVNKECSYWALEWDTTKYDNGWHKICAKTTDGIAWADTCIEVQVHNEKEENHPPHVKIQEPLNGETVHGLVTIHLCAWDADGNDEIEGVFVRIDGGDWHKADFLKVNAECSFWSFEWDTTKVENGWHKICAKATDGKAWADTCIEVYVHNKDDTNHPPGVKIHEPVDGEDVHGVIPIFVCAWDPDGNDDIREVFVRIDAGDWHEATWVLTNAECSLWVLEWDTTTVENGWHKICTKATDGKAWADDCIEVYVHNP